FFVFKMGERLLLSEPRSLGTESRRNLTMFGQPGKTRRLIWGIGASVALAIVTTSAQSGNTWYASAPNSSIAPTGTACTQQSPCPLSYAIGTKVVAGDTLILYSGTYTDKPTLNNASKHSRLTITAMPDVISGLTFKRGIVTGGTDNRPY